MTVSFSHANAALSIPTRNMLYTSPQGHIQHLVAFRKCSCLASIPTKAIEAFLIAMGGQNNSGKTSWRPEVEYQDTHFLELTVTLLILLLYTLAKQKIIQYHWKNRVNILNKHFSY